MNIDIRVPDLPESDDKVTIAKIYVEPGQQVEINDPLFDIENGKVVLEVSAPQNGIIEKIDIRPKQHVKAKQLVMHYAPTHPSHRIEQADKVVEQIVNKQNQSSTSIQEQLFHVDPTVHKSLNTGIIYSLVAIIFSVFVGILLLE
ncbi:biotin/lipoyl-containing protein [Thalassotalea sp. PLHSN55]|uniref:biotin/lipoyl-containing protein n=1 Tax=Thalassotalea sp. PLHSN55 TaxID=3435888 RepID=UPI003F855935